MIKLPYSIQAVQKKERCTMVDYHCGNLFFSRVLSNLGFTITGLTEDPTLHLTTAQKYGIPLKTREEYHEIPIGVLSTYTLNVSKDPKKTLLDMRSLEATWYILEVISSLASPLRLKGVCNKADQLTAPFKGFTTSEIIRLVDSTGFRILKLQHKGRSIVIHAKRKL